MSNGLPDPAAAQREDVSYGPLPGYLGHLLRRAQARVFADFADALGEAVSPAEFGLLTLVAANPGITQVRLAAALSLDKSTLSPALARLTRRGLLKRERLASDGRLQALRLAPGAEATYATLRARVEAHEARIAAALSPAEHAELLRLLRLLLGWDLPGPSAPAR
ncbi:MarR family winged helix-turn-helix transcriptional regulator [Falsiroseomonas oryzae]|uniref:MarR family winged helix-turn-helix transcriptional regulator n=1 Tax=Falsiroseomonas oryzae TaxID=2766473 RepID=UPI0022EACF6A|nr:MarR family winged helix-turn-helix transcriptional regulator [Roseomonas sp. MO-31]